MSILATAGLLLLAGCTGEPSAPTPPRDPGAPRFQLVAFDSCADALAGLKKAASATVGPWGFMGRDRLFAAGDGAVGGAPAPAARSALDSAEQAAPSHSGTNTHEAGVDEPDLVKTDGRRIVTVSRGILTVVDAATRAVTGTVDLTEGRAPDGWSESQLLLSGDHALVLIPWYMYDYRMPVGVADDRGIAPQPPNPDEAAGPRIVLVDLAAKPSVLASYRIDGSLVDARQVGATARVVVRSSPRIEFPYPKSEDKRSDRKRLADNRAAIQKSTMEDWLPRYESTVGDTVQKGHVDCGRVSRPAVYSGTSMLTVLSFDLGQTSLGDGQPTTLVADGGTVYSNGPSLYVAADQQWRTAAWDFDRRGFKPADQTTDVYRFDTSQPGAPRFAGAGTVPGWLVNQYAMSEWDGHLRVATTSGIPWGTEADSSSAVYVLRVGDDALDQVGQLGGLGRGERIYSVRFAGEVGYVVTFRQVDPLYTVDLSEPRSPRKMGELKITGYSAYLHPVDRTRLIGIGQEASSEGRTQGTQVSLFDVSDLTKPGRLAQFHVKQGHSEAEFDPHAFLYWPADRTLVVPINSYANDGSSNGGAMVLRVSDTSITELGLVRHPTPRTVNYHQGNLIRRSLMVDGTLWTVSDAGLRATDPVSMNSLAWIAF